MLMSHFIGQTGIQVCRLYGHHQSRMTSNRIAITPSHSYNAGKVTWGGVGGGGAPEYKLIG